MEAEDLTKKLANDNSELSNEVLDFIAETGEALESLQNKKQALEAENAKLKTERITLIKVADEAKKAASSQAQLNEDSVKKAMRSLQNLALLSEGAAEKLASRIEGNSDAIFEVIDVLADSYYKIATSGTHGALVDPTSREHSGLGEDPSEEESWRKLAEGQYE